MSNHETFPNNCEGVERLLSRVLTSYLNGMIDDDDTVLDALGIEGDEPTLKRVETFADVGIMTNNRGLEIKTADGSVFQVSIVRRRL